jgi:thymidine phosphorylase
MDEPIGTRVGNALEVRESIEVLAGAGPADTRELTVRLGAEMLVVGGLCRDADAGAARIAGSLDDGSAREVFRKLVAAQGGDARVVDDPDAVLPRAHRRTPVPAPIGGTVTAVAADEIGVAALLLGAGRRAKTDTVDPAVGVELLCRVGDVVAAGAPLAMLYHNDRGADAAAQRVTAAYALGAAPANPSDTPAGPSRILEVLR